MQQQQVRNRQRPIRLNESRILFVLFGLFDASSVVITLHIVIWTWLLHQLFPNAHSQSSQQITHRLAGLTSFGEFRLALLIQVCGFQEIISSVETCWCKRSRHDAEPRAIVDTSVPRMFTRVTIHFSFKFGPCFFFKLDSFSHFKSTMNNKWISILNERRDFDTMSWKMKALNELKKNVSGSPSDLECQSVPVGPARTLLCNYTGKYFEG